MSAPGRLPVPVPLPVPGLFLLLALLAPTLSLATPERAAHPLSFRSTAERGRVKLGEPLAYTVEIRHRPEEWYTLRPGAALAPFSAGEARCRRDAQAKEAVTTCTLPLSLFALGDADVPELAFDADGPGGKAVLRVPGPRISAVTLTDPDEPAEALPLRDLAPPVPVWVRSLRVLWWALAVLGAAALAALGWRAGRAWRRRTAGREPPPLTAAERFERQLDALEAEWPGAREEAGSARRRGEGGARAAEHLARLAELVREYLAAVAAVPALELTTGELLGALRGTADAARLDVGGLEVFLGEADRVKFARQPAGPEACAAGMAYARGLLERTRPAPAAPAAGGRARVA